MTLTCSAFSEGIIRRFGKLPLNLEIYIHACVRTYNKVQGKGWETLRIDVAGERLMLVNLLK